MADDSEHLSVVVEKHDNQTVVRLRGELDIATAPAFADAVSEANSEIVVDLADLEFLDASGLDALARARARAERHGYRLVVINVHPLTQRMFQLTGLDYLLSGSDAL